MASLGVGLVVSAPSGPVQGLVGDVTRAEGDRGQEASDFGHGQRDRLVGGRWAGGGDGGEEGQCEHREGDVAVPARPGAYLVVIQADLAFGGLERLFDAPADPGDACRIPSALKGGEMLAEPRPRRARSAGR